MGWRSPDWRMRSLSDDGQDNITGLERGPQGSGGVVETRSSAHRGGSISRMRQRLRTEQTRVAVRRMAGSALTLAFPRKAPIRTVRCLMLEAVPGKTRRTVFRGGGWKRGLWRNCDPSLQPKGQGWKPSAYGCARQCPTRQKASHHFHPESWAGTREDGG